MMMIIPRQCLLFVAKMCINNNFVGYIVEELSVSLEDQQNELRVLKRKHALAMKACSKALFFNIVLS